MAWQLVGPGQVRQGEPGESTVLFRGSGPLERGELLLSVAADGHVTEFILSHIKSPGSVEYLAEWFQDRGFRVGEVDAGEQVGEHGYRHKMSPIVHRYGQPALPVVAQLLDYFERNAEVLESPHREHIATVLRGALQGGLRSGKPS